MYDYKYKLRCAALDSMKDEPVDAKARVLNMMEAIFDGNMSIDDLVDGIANDTLPKIYIPASHNPAVETTGAK